MPWPTHVVQRRVVAGIECVWGAVCMTLPTECLFVLRGCLLRIFCRIDASQGTLPGMVCPITLAGCGGHR